MPASPLPYCRRGHRIETSQDRTPSGHCRQCKAITERDYRLRRSVKLAFIAKMLELGWVIDPVTLEATPTREAA